MTTALEKETSVKSHHVFSVPSFMWTCCFPLPISAALIEHTVKTVNEKYIFSFWPHVWKFQSKVQQTIVLTTELSVHTFSSLPFPFPLYMEMKRSFMLFPLVALFIAVWRFISWFHLRFRRLFLGKPLKCVSDSKQSFSRFLSLAPVAFPLMINPPPKIFKVNWATSCSQNPFNTVLRKGDVVLVPWLTWKENRGSFLSLALLASLVLYGWTSNDWLGVICVTIEATWTLFYVVCWRLLHSEWGGFLLKRADVFRIRPLDGGATPDSGWGWREVERGVGITGRYERFGDV